VEAIEAIESVLAPRSNVRLAYLFGSAARGRERASSDVDIAILFDGLPEPHELDRLTSDLEGAGCRRVDLVVLNTAPPLLTHEVLRTGRVLVCRDDDDRARFELRAIARYLDTAHLRALQRASLREWAEAARARPS
jgi:hypothetical protein